MRHHFFHSAFAIWSLVSIGCVDLAKPTKDADCTQSKTCSRDTGGNDGITGARPDAPVSEDDAGTPGEQPDVQINDPILDAALMDQVPTPDRSTDTVLDLPSPDSPPTETPVVDSGIEAGILHDSNDGVNSIDSVDATDGNQGIDANVSTVCSNAGLPQPLGTLCRSAVGPCDQAESCNGISLDCPADTFLPATTVCRAGSDVCDLPEACSGTSAVCPDDRVAAAGKECRPSAGVCDIAETCDGTGKTCPTDDRQPDTFLCRQEMGDCDQAETCDGSDPDCPPDQFYSSGSLCRIANGTCDQNAYCTGTSALCAQNFSPQGTICRASTSDCDPAEICSGSTGACSSDLFYTAPASAPGNVLGTSAAGSTSATLTWDAVDDAIGYTVKRSTGTSTTYIAVGTTTSLTYTDSGLTGGTTYHYVVAATGGLSSCESPNSTMVSVTPSGVCSPAAPSIPAEFAASAGNRQITLSWTASANANSYILSKSTNETTGYSTLNTGIITGTNYTDGSLTNDTEVWYRIMAKGANCNSDWSLPISATPICSPPSPLPVILSAIPDANGQVTVTWSASTNALSYQLLRSETSDGTYTTVATLPATAAATQYTTTDTPLITPGTQKTFFYLVSALIDTTCSSVSTSALQAIACKAPAAPILAANAANAQVNLTWNSSTGASSYEIHRSPTATGPFASIVTMDQPATNYDYPDTGLGNGSTYYYQLKAILGSLCSNTSNLVSATPCLAPTATATTVTDNTMALSWNNTGAPSYTIRYGTSPSALGTTATVAGTSHTIGGLVAGTPYYAVVSSSNPSCTSGDSAVVQATPTGCSTVPGTPALTATESNGQVTLAWTAATGGTGTLTYELAYSLSSGGPYTNLPGVLTSPYVHTGLSNGTTYYYVVRAKDSAGCTSGNSTEVSATPTAAVCAGAFCDTFETYALGGAAAKWTVGLGTWTVQNDSTAPVGPKVYQLISTTSAGYYSRAGTESYGDATIEATIKVLGFGSRSTSHAAGVYLRNSGSAQYILSIAGDGKAYLRRSLTSSSAVETCSSGSIPNSPSSLVTVTSSPPYTTNWFKLKLVVSGTRANSNITLRGYVDSGSGFPSSPNVNCTLISTNYAIDTGTAGVQSRGTAPALFDDVIIRTP